MPARPKPLVAKIVSGGQTGVDRAALDAARELGIPHGGWCPAGRRAEDGPLPAAYRLRETNSAGYAQRTRWNVRDSDGTLVLLRGRARGGSALTLVVAEKLRMPAFTFDLGAAADPEPIQEWLRAHAIASLNVAGPRESESPGIYEAATALLRCLLTDPSGP